MNTKKENACNPKSNEVCSKNPCCNEVTSCSSEKEICDNKEKPSCYDSDKLCKENQ